MKKLVEFDTKTSHRFFIGKKDIKLD